MGRRPVETSRPRHAAGWIVGPVAVEADQAPLHAPADAEPAGSFQDRIMDRVAGAVGDVRHRVAEAARNGLRRAAPRPECDFPNTIDADDVEVRGPVLRFLVAE